mmetsp:Transcript_36532/g.56123  ORF Transcript_36532/g.56123 Transcript_36532/m.56123 type:complete len:140 (+) Transcript_36532:479-898(+)
MYQDNEFHFVELDTSLMNTQNESTAGIDEFAKETDSISTMHPKRKQKMKDTASKDSTQNMAVSTSSTSGLRKTVIHTQKSTESSISTLRDELMVELNEHMCMLRVEIKDDISNQMSSLNNMLQQLLSEKGESTKSREFR